MVEPINLRQARKQAKRRDDSQQADAQRLAYGQPKHVRNLQTARQDKAGRDLDQHKIETGERR